MGVILVTAAIGGIIAAIGLTAAISSNRAQAARHKAEKHDHTYEPAHR